MKTDKISVIIPIYNVQDYLSICLNTILEQTYSNLEIICIDDGSTDRSGEICDEYALTDKRFVVHHISNQGVSNARNYALSIMTGDWFAFVDSDDWIDTNYFEVLYHNAIVNNCDISACGFQRNIQYVQKNDTEQNNKKARSVLFYSPLECIHSFICSKDSLQGMTTNKLYRAERYKDITFDINVKVNEDCLYTYNVMQRCEKACLTTAPMYHWFTRIDSASHTKNIKANFTAANVFLYLYKDTLQYNDREVSLKLQVNYISSVLKVLLYAKYKRNNPEILDAKKQCSLWKKDVWCCYNIKNKVKYYIAFYIPWLVKQKK